MMKLKVINRAVEMCVCDDHNLFGLNFHQRLFHKQKVNIWYLRSWSEPSSPFLSSLLFINGNFRENVKFFFFRSSVDC